MIWENTFYIRIHTHTHLNDVYVDVHIYIWMMQKRHFRSAGKWEVVAFSINGAGYLFGKQNEIGPLLHVTYKSQFHVDYRQQCAGQSLTANSPRGTIPDLLLFTEVQGVHTPTMADPQWQMQSPGALH